MSDAADRLVVTAEPDIIAVQQAVARCARRAGLSSFGATRLITAASELARNLLVHATGGRAEVTVIEQPRPGVRVVVADDGPGIADIATALRDGYSTGGGLGLGLPGARRLVDDFAIISRPGEGTVVTVTMWRR